MFLYPHLYTSLLEKNIKHLHLCYRYFTLLQNSKSNTNIHGDDVHRISWTLKANTYDTVLIFILFREILYFVSQHLISVHQKNFGQTYLEEFTMKTTSYKGQIEVCLPQRVTERFVPTTTL